MQLVREFYEEVLRKLVNSPAPVVIRSIIYDPRFTAKWVIENLDNFDFDDSLPEYYQMLFSEFDDNADSEDVLTFACTSDDVHDPVENGEYIYYTGVVSPGIGVLFMQATHGWILPSYLMICGPNIQIEVSNCKMDVMVYPVNTVLRDILLTSNDGIREEKIIEFLRNSDRPRLPDRRQDDLYFLTPE